MKSNYSKLVKAVCSLEGKKKPVSIGNVREVLKCLKVTCKDPVHFATLVEYLKK